MASIDVIFTSTYHTKQLNPWPNSLASRVVNYSQLSACQVDMQSFEGDPYSRGRLTSLRNKPQQKQPGQLSASIPGWIVSQRVQLLFDGEKCVLLLCAWKLAFLRSGHIYPNVTENRQIYFNTVVNKLLNCLLHRLHYITLIEQSCNEELATGFILTIILGREKCMEFGETLI